VFISANCIANYAVRTVGIIMVCLVCYYYYLLEMLLKLLAKK